MWQAVSLSPRIRFLIIKRKPSLSICIPAYNRAQYLPALLDSILTQNQPEIEIVITEDNSPERPRIARIVREYQQRGVDCIRYFENEKTLGFDGNVRSLFERANGDYCLMMGNDDLLCPGSLATISGLLAQHPEVAVAIRSYGWFFDKPEEVDQVVKYFPATTIFAPGVDTVVTFFRRVGVLAGLVFRRQDALAVSTDRFDGTLYYQVYLAAELLLKGHGLYIADTIAICRENKPDFGHSAAEKEKFQPGLYTSNARIVMIQSFLSIATHIDSVHNLKIYPRILKDLGNYSYFFLAFLADSRFPEFFRNYCILGKMGLKRNLMFHLYFWSLALFGKARCEFLIKKLRSNLNATPRLGKLAEGISLSSANSEASVVSPGNTK